MMRRFFLKRLKRYSLMLMTPSLLLLIALFIINSTAQLRSLKQDSSRAVDSIRRGFNTIYEDTCYQQNMMTLNPQLTLSLRKILMRGRSSYTDYVFLNSMKSILQSAAGSHPSIHTIYLYIDGYENFLASSDGVRPLDNYFDTDWLTQYEALPDDSDNAVMRRVIPASAYQRQHDVLTIFQRLTYIRGVIVINIEESVFTDSIAAALPYPENALRISLDDGQELLSIGAYPSADSEIGMNHDAVEPGFARIGGGRYLRAFSHDNRLALNYALLLPVSVVWAKILAGMAAPLLVVLLVAVLTFILAWWTTRQNFRQIDEVIQLFEAAEKGTLSAETLHPTQINDEYDLIINNVIRSFMNTTFLDKQLSEQKYQKQVAELTALQLQINPHFLMNTLQTLDFEVCKLTNSFHSPLNVIISNLSDILRYSMASVRTPVTVQDELENVQKYVEIQNFRFPDTIFMDYDVDDEALELPFKRLLLQPLVENSISHGIRPTLRPGHIHIRIALEGDWLAVSCTDDGAGIAPEKLKTLRENLSQGDGGTSIGLNNVNRRLVLNYGEQSALTLESEPGCGARVAFRIPLETGVNPGEA